jgi:hypothetical protein
MPATGTRLSVEHIPNPTPAPIDLSRLADGFYSHRCGSLFSSSPLVSLPIDRPRRRAGYPPPPLLCLPFKLFDRSRVSNKRHLKWCFESAMDPGQHYSMAAWRLRVQVSRVRCVAAFALRSRASSWSVCDGTNWHRQVNNHALHMRVYRSVHLHTSTAAVAEHRGAYACVQGRLTLGIE